jgi:hypothetical protein
MTAPQVAMARMHLTEALTRAADSQVRATLNTALDVLEGEPPQFPSSLPATAGLDPSIASPTALAQYWLCLRCGQVGLPLRIAAHDCNGGSDCHRES